MQVVVLCDDNRLGQVVLDTLHANSAKSWLIYTNRAKPLRFSRSAIPLMAVQGALATQTDAMVQAINRLHNEHRIDSVLATDVRGALFLCDNRDRLGPPVFPLPDRATLQTLDDKWRFYLYCQKLGLPVPKTLCFETRAIDVREVEQEIGFPTVMKPLNENGGRGFAVARNRDHLKVCVANYRYRFVLFQKYIAGNDLGLSLFAQDGRIRSVAAFRCGPKLRTEFADLPVFAHICERIIASTNYTGVANFDARIDSAEQISLLECNPRFFARLNAVRLAGLDLLRMGLPGVEPSGGSQAVGTVFSRGDIRGISRMLYDSSTARTMIRSWSEFLADPAPYLVARLRGVSVGHSFPFGAGHAAPADAEKVH